LFILVNSFAGITGFLIKNNSIPLDSFLLVPIALIGGTLGAIYGSKKFTNQTLTYMLSFVLLVASIKLFII
ncbi:MAG: sulfite exporter TauE/SafE family protein, partial [Bacteroidia bacterium]|nr:sulfite exporter TauE/SafE family protein [Bacteroidia bacterium]